MKKTYKLIYEVYLAVLVADEDRLDINLPRLVASILMVLSGFLLYLDKAITYFDIKISVPEKFIAIGWDQSLFIWFTTQTLAPIMICIGAWLRAYRVSILVPIYAWFLQMYFLLFDAHIIDDSYLSLYCLGTTLLLIASIRIIEKIYKKHIKDSVRKKKEMLLREIK